MKIEIKDNKLIIDDQEKKVTELNAILLDLILDKAIMNEVEFNLIDDKHPVFNFFKNLQIETTKGSDFMVELEKLENEKKEEENKNGI